MATYCCVVCKEEITAKELSYSTNLFNMALCRKHQDTQKQIKAKAEAEQKTNSITEPPKTVDSQDSCCIVCQEKITTKEYNYSKSLFNLPLCRKHQEIQKQIKIKTETEPKTNQESRNDPIGNKNVITPSISNTLAYTQDTLTKWLTEWVIGKPIYLSIEAKQFFVVGMELEEFARDAIGKAQDEILVTSPYVDNCFLATALQRAVERRVKVKVVARRPADPKTQKIDVQKAECHANLKKEGLIIHYINQIHSKIIVIDRKIAVISSMNLYSGSTGGATFEAGIVSFDKTVVDSTVKYVTELLEKPESPDGPNAISKPYYRSNHRY
jgi:hypothetical protein